MGNEKMAERKIYHSIAEKGLAFDPFYDLLQKYADEHGWYYTNQGRNPENPNVHIATTGPEIWDATGGDIDFQYDEVVEVNADLAYEVGRDLVKTDGIFLGQSAAAAIKVATDIAKRPEAKGKTIVAICADNAFKYLSTNI
jgi:cysteine synthase